MRWSSPVLHLIGIGWFFAVSIILGLAAGLWIDDQAATAPIFTLIGLFLGLAVAFVGGYRLLAEVTLRGSKRGED